MLFSWLFTHQVWCRGLGPRGVHSLHTVFKNEELGEQYGNVLLHEGLDRKKKKKKMLGRKSAKCARYGAFSKFKMLMSYILHLVSIPTVLETLEKMRT